METVATPMALPRRRAVAGSRWFFTAFALATAAAVFVGFAPTWFLKRFYASTPALSGLLQVHGVAFTAWMALFVLQPLLIALGRTGLHRRLGAAGAALAAVMTVLAYLASIDAARRGATMPPLTALAFLAIPLATVVVFPVLAGLAIWFRHRPDIHKRLMVLATVELVSAAIARMTVISSSGPLAFFGATDLFIVALALFDVVTLKRVHQATLWGGLFLIASQAVRTVVTGMAWWTDLARWLVG
jgi:hypothetical protein